MPSTPSVFVDGSSDTVQRQRATGVNGPGHFGEPQRVRQSVMSIHVNDVHLSNNQVCIDFAVSIDDAQFSSILIGEVAQ